MQAMNRSLANVILGGYGTSTSTAQAMEGSHTETDVRSTVDALTQVCAVTRHLHALLSASCKSTAGHLMSGNLTWHP